MVLVGAGMSNRLAASQLYLYLSPKTVEFHLGRIYRKLGVTSRCQLPRPAPQAANTGRELRPRGSMAKTPPSSSANGPSTASTT